MANTPNGLINYINDKNIVLGDKDERGNFSYEYEFNNINTSGTGKLFNLNDVNIELYSLASSSSKIVVDEYNSLLIEEDFKDISKIKFVDGKNKWSNDELNTSIRSNQYLHKEYKTNVTEIPEDILNKLKKNNEEIILSRVILLSRPEGLEENEFYPNENNKTSAIIEIPEDGRNKEDLIGRAYQLIDGNFVEINNSYENVNSSKPNYIRNIWKFTNEQIMNGVYITLADGTKITNLKDNKTDVSIITPSPLDKTYSLVVNKDFDNIWDSVAESILPSVLKDIYQFEISSTTENATIPDGNYKVSLPLPQMGENDTIVIYEIVDGVKTERQISYQINGKYVEFEITKEDLINKTIFALGVLEGSKTFVSGNYTLTTDVPIYKNCQFTVEEREVYASKSNAVQPLKFNLKCGDKYTKPDAIYTITTNKPGKTNGDVSISLEGTKIEITQTTENNIKKISFNISKDNFGSSEYKLIYKKNCESVSQNKFTITFNSNGANEIEPLQVNLNEETTLPIPVKEGYEFLGWHYSNGDKVETTKANEVKHSNLAIEDEYGCPINSYVSVNLVAEWQERKVVCEKPSKSFKLIYNSNGGSEFASETITDNSTEKLPEPNKTGYKFLGWYYDEELTNKVSDEIKKKELSVSEIKDTTGCTVGYNDLTLYAKWDEIVCIDVIDVKFNIIFDVNGGTKIENKLIDLSDNTKVLVPIPQKSGYVFAGWYYENGTKLSVDDLKKVDTKIKKNSDGCTIGYEDITLKAKWTEETYNSGGSSNGGNSGSSNNGNNGSEKPKCNEPKKNITIIYKTNGGTELANNAYGSIISFEELGVTKKEGYIFDGWYYDENLSNLATKENWYNNIINVNLETSVDKETGCTTENKGSLTLYASWKKDSSDDYNIITSKDGDTIYNELLGDDDYTFEIDKLSKNENAFIKGIIENATKSVQPKVIIDIYKFNLKSDSLKELPGGKYKISILITDKIKNYDDLEIVALDSLGNKIDRKIELTKVGNYLVFEINKEDLSTTHFALIGNLIEQVPTGIIFKTGSFILLFVGIVYISINIKKKNKVYKI